MKRSVFLTFLLLTLFGTGVAQADILFNNFGAGDTFDTGTGWNVFGATNSLSVLPQESAMSFMPSETANLSSIDFVTSLLPAGGTNDIALSLVNDSLGAPLGSTLESWTFTNQMGTLGTIAPILTAISLVHPLLNAGTTYWLVASPPVSDTEAVWNFNSIGDTVAGTVSLSIDGGSTWGPPPPGSPPDIRGVFRVNSPAVPEPSTILLLGAGLAGVGLLRRRLRRH